MTNIAELTARRLISIYEERFANQSYNQFRVTWPELRAIAGVTKLTDAYLNELKQALNVYDFALISLANFLVVTLECDLTHIRSVSSRIFEQYLPGTDDTDKSDEPLPKLGPRTLGRFYRNKACANQKDAHVTA